MKDAKNYRDGGQGMIEWCDDRVYLPIYPPGSDIAIWTRMGDLPTTPNPKTGRSYREMWENQQIVLRQALAMEDKKFVYRLIVFCWMRGEGKSLLAVLIQLWKFFNWPRQQIMLGANSKDQVKFVHFDMMRDIILNSPNLLLMVGGHRNIQEKEIRMKDGDDSIRSIIRSISSFTGIVSNITGYTFSEMFDMKNPRFFVQLDGSIRTIPNALGVIDSTVSAKTHVLYQLYTSFIQRKTKTVFFSYRSSPGGLIEDFWNPGMDSDQLEDYKVKFPFGEFDKYFKNIWSAGLLAMFPEEVVEEVGIAGVHGHHLNHVDIKLLVDEKYKKIDQIAQITNKGLTQGIEHIQNEIDLITAKFKPMDDIYTLGDRYRKSMIVTMRDLDNFSQVFDTDWSIHAGVDFGDPYATKGLARTILTFVAKGLPGSKIQPHLFHPDEVAPKFLYLLIGFLLIDNHSLNAVKTIVEEANNEWAGIDTLCSERYGAWDVQDWCEERDIEFEAIFPNYERQKAAFKELLEAVTEGRFKSPTVVIAGSKESDLLREEMKEFNHDSERKWFGSSEKFEKFGIQDDSMFSIGWGIYGGRNKNIQDFRPRRNAMNFGYFQDNKANLGNYA